MPIKIIEVSRDSIDKVKRASYIEEIPELGDPTYDDYVLDCGFLHVGSGTIIFLTRDISRLPEHRALPFCWHLSLGFRQPLEYPLTPLLPWRRVTDQSSPKIEFNWELANLWIHHLLPRDAQIFYEGVGLFSPTPGIEPLRYWPISFYVFTDEQWRPLPLTSLQILELTTPPSPLRIYNNKQNAQRVAQQHFGGASR